MSRYAAPMLILFALTLFSSAFLLFMVQPLMGKLIVPLLGGFPAVWNTCMVFFQAMLLAGYAYAHWSTTYLGARRQAALHLVLMLLPFVVLPLGVYENLVPSGDKSPVPGLLLLLAVSVGLPFFVISTTAPLLQQWFASTGHPAAKDPYFLYAASNAGSILALLSYPILIEPQLELLSQRRIWTAGYAILVLLIGVCAALLWLSRRPTPHEAGKPAPPPPAPAKSLPPAPVSTGSSRLSRLAADLSSTSLTYTSSSDDALLSAGQVLRWIALAFVPSSLMLGVTTYMTTDIASIPLLWILPLGLYLLSFILVFSRLPALIHKGMVLALPVLLLLLVFMMISGLKEQMWRLILLHLVVFFCVAMVCHGELARTRPSARYLTAFYLWMSVGGVLGGLFNALLAPVLFSSLAEYPVAMVVAALLIPRLDSKKQPSRTAIVLDLTLPLLVAIFSVEFFWGFPLSCQLFGSGTATIGGWVETLAEWIHMKPANLHTVLVYGPTVLLCYILGYVLGERPLCFGLGLAALFLVSNLPEWSDPHVLYRNRSFFGALKVKQDESLAALPPLSSFLKDLLGFEKEETEGPNSGYTTLTHGNILHGKQARLPERRREPLTYYHRTGPVGQLLAAFTGDRAKRDLAVIGLGTGTMACYPEAGQKLTFYEIDRVVKRISFDQKQYFSYVHDAKARGAEINIVLGDARVSLDREWQTRPGEKYDVIVVDAFSSDAIPMHLMTWQALQIYLDKLKPDGIVAFHTSNRYLRLEPVVGNIAAKLGCVALMQSESWEDMDLLRQDFLVIDASTAGLLSTPFGRGPWLAAFGLYLPRPSQQGKCSSTWVMVARAPQHFGELLEDVGQPNDQSKRWHWVGFIPGIGVWSDDFSNLVKVYDWKSK